MMRFAGQCFVAAANSLTAAVEVRSTSVPFSRARAIVAASRHHHAAAQLGLHNAAPVRTGHRWLIAPGAGTPAVVGFPYWPCHHARKAHTSAVPRAAGGHVPPRALLVKVGDGSYRVLRPPPGKDISHFLDMDATTLLETIASSSTFAKSMEGVAQDKCTVSFVTSTAKVQPAAEELAQSTLLEGLHTLGEKLGTAEGSVWVHIKAPTVLSAAGPRLVADATLLPALPAPVTFKEAGLVDGASGPMHVAELPTSGPFFLEDTAHRKVLEWVREHPSATVHKLLVLTGPIKSGKTALLKTVLPCVMAAQYAAAGGPKPVFFHFAFTLGHGPGEAALKLVRAAAAKAVDLGFDISSVPPTEELALVEFPRVMSALAAGIAAGGGELVLLIDEAQAPVVAAPSPEAAVKFASSLKDMNTECRATSRIAITGSGMVALLNTLRMIAPNGYTLWGAMARVQLGATPPRASAAAMAADIISFRRRSRNWPQAVSDLVTPEYVLQLLESGADASRITAPRPALVAYMADLMEAANVGSAAQVAAAAFKELQDKLAEEAKVDAAVALGHLTVERRAQIYVLASGDMKRSALQAHLDLAKESKFMDLLGTVCEPPSAANEDRLQLLAPYPALFKAMLEPSGNLLVKWAGNQWRLDERLSNRLKFFGEHWEEVIRRCGAAISSAVLDTLAANGIGVPTAAGAVQRVRAPATILEVQQVPAVKAIFDILNTQEATKQQRDEALSKSVNKFKRLAADQAAASPSANADAANFLANAGVHVLLWLRHVEAHAYIPKTVLVDAGLQANVVGRIVDAAVRSWEASGNEVTSEGLPFLPIRGPLAAGLNRDPRSAGA